MYNPNKTVTLIIVAIAGLIVSSCSDSTTGVSEPESEIEVQLVEDLDARGENGEYTFYSLREGLEISRADSVSNKWDVAFRGTSVIFNSSISGPGSGAALKLDLPFGEVEMAPSEGYVADTEESNAIPTGSGNGWYVYTGNGNPSHAILPIEDVTIVLKSGDGNHYAKMEILSYYEGNPDTSTEEFANRETRPAARYYTFRYAIQMTEGLRDLN